MSRITKRSAKAITTDLDRLAQLFESAHTELGVPKKVAADFAYRCDLLSDYLDKAATGDVHDDPEDIVDGNVEKVTEPDEPYMDVMVEQDDLYELREKVESGDLGKGASLKALAAQLLRLADEEEADEEEADEEEADEEEADEKASKSAKKSEEEEEEDADEEDADDEADASKSASLLAKHLLRLMKANDEADDDDDDDDDDSEADKEAHFNHGYAL
jgi:chemotaxis protein histidine kinase CheA